MSRFFSIMGYWEDIWVVTEILFDCDVLPAVSRARTKRAYAMLGDSPVWKTIESLAETVGFSSYVTFHLAFKSITGESFPQLITFETRSSQDCSAFWTKEGKAPLKPFLLSSKNATGGLYPRELCGRTLL